MRDFIGPGPYTPEFWGQPRNPRRGVSNLPNIWVPRRDRLIHKALLRARRRWDTYAAIVRKEQLDGELSSRLPEWRMIKQNSSLVQRLKALPENVEKMKVLNKTQIPGLVMPKGAVYIGRPSKWGNPYRIGRDGNRETVIKKFMDYAENLLDDDPAYFDELLPATALVCYCAPKRCHGDVIKGILRIRKSRQSK